jgi:hypothetical protein
MVLICCLILSDSVVEPVSYLKRSDTSGIAKPEPPECQRRGYTYEQQTLFDSDVC